MRIGVPSEIKNHEYRVALTPSGVHELRAHGHEVLVQAGAGTGSSISDDDYRAEGAVVLDDADVVWGRADVVLKVKELVEQEYSRLRPGLTLFTYLHLAAGRRLTEELVAKEVTAIAYETVQTADGVLLADHVVLTKYPQNELRRFLRSMGIAIGRDFKAALRAIGLHLVRRPRTRAVSARCW